jgi:Fur family peroxide stress response transcriptional regulator
MNEAVKKLKEKNIRITPQRVQIYNMLIKEKKHLTAEEIYEKIRRVIPAVSLATVYTALDIFKEKELIEEIRIRFDKSCFGARTDRHHHFLCRVCGKIFDIDIPPCPTLQKMEVEGNAIEELQGYFYGRCRKCLEK